jgi:hypothetical protein
MNAAAPRGVRTGGRAAIASPRRAPLLGGEGVLQQAFGRGRPAGAAEHVNQGAQRYRHLPVARIVEESPSKEGAQSSSTRTSCPERRNGSATASAA